MSSLGEEHEQDELLLLQVNMCINKSNLHTYTCVDVITLFADIMTNTITKLQSHFIISIKDAYMCICVFCMYVFHKAVLKFEEIRILQN